MGFQKCSLLKNLWLNYENYEKLNYLYPRKDVPLAKRIYP